MGKHITIALSDTHWQTALHPLSVNAIMKVTELARPKTQKDNETKRATAPSLLME